jgi:hypothetical protein
MAFALTDWLQVVGSLGSLLSGLGLVGTMATVMILARQTRAVQQANVTTAYQGIIGMENAFTSALLERPEIFNMLRDPALVVDRWDFDEQMRLRPQVAIFTVQQLDCLELVLVSIAAFPHALQAEWRDYIRLRLQRNPYMRRALLDTDWYTAELRALAE